LIRKIADWRIPLAMVLTVTIISGVFYIVNPVNGSPFFHLFSGGLILGLFFMVTDPVTTPFTKSGRYIFGIGCGLLVMVIRYFSGLPEGVMYAILFMNAVTPLINRYTQPLAFGRK
jgi:electron transport complex protein RnfD